MRRFFNRDYWKSEAQKKGLFGGEIKSKEEIWALNKRIKEKEKAEFEAFEKEFDKKMGQNN